MDDPLSMDSSQGQPARSSGPWVRLPEIRILHLEEDPAERSRFARALNRVLTARSHKLLLEQAGSLEEGLQRLESEQFGLVVANLDLPDSCGIATVDALAKGAPEIYLVIYATNPDVASVGSALEHGADDFFDTAVFDPRVLDQVLGRLIEKAMLASSLMDLVQGRDTILAHRRELDHKMHRLISSMLAITLEPLTIEEAIARVIELLLGPEGIGDLEAGLCFLHDPVAGGCRLAVHRGIDPSAVERLDTVDLSGCTCTLLRGDSRTWFSGAGKGPLPPCQVAFGHHASYVATLFDHAARPLGNVSMWVQPDAPHDDDVAQLVENVGRVVSSIIAHHHQVDRVRRLHQVIEQSPLSVLLTDTNGNITYANPQLFELTGFHPDEVLGQNPRIFSSGLVSKETFQEMWTVLGEGSVWEGELINRKKDGSLYTERAIISPVIDDQGRIDCYAAVKRDITQELRYKAQLKHQATHDPLTDLANRSMVGDRVAQAIKLARRHKRFVVALLMDIDDFGSLNEAQGHAAGDAILREVAKRLSAQARDYDTIARLGNDEFIVVLGDIADERLVLDLANKYLGVFQEPFESAERGAVKMTASMGVATYPIDSRDGTELLRHASMALARRRSLGPGGYALFGQEMEEDLRERYELLTALRVALDPPPQFELHYQPQVEPMSGDICGAEALLRWERPGGQQVSPMKFIPLAESSGMIVPIGAWVLETACQQFAAWNRESGVAFPVSVNVSGRQFHEPGFADTVQRALDSSGLDPALLVLELTESLLLHNPDEARLVMERISTLGVRLAIDDFGTGYSSLSYLTNLPIHQLKVDRAFIRDIRTDPQSEVIVSTIIGMAHSLGLEVVAEGAETDDQVSFLQTYRCNMIQGYRYSRPLPVAQFEGLIQSPPWLDALPGMQAQNGSA